MLHHPAAQVFIVHSGDQTYLDSCIAAAGRYARVRVLSFDAPDADEQFGRVVQNYIHLSGQTVEFELHWCLRRYFILRDHFASDGVAGGWLIDSDVLLVAELPDPSEFPENTYCALSYLPAHELDLHASAHCSYWTLEALRAFCDFIEETYRDRADALRAYDKHRRAHGIRSAISDMLLLGDWGKGNSRVFDLFDFTAGGMIDHNLRLFEQPRSVQLKSQFGNKRLVRKGGEVFAEASDGTLIKLRCLHFQGKAKMLMGDFYHGRDLRFHAKAALRYAYNRLRLALRQLRGERIPVERAPAVATR